MFSGLEVLINEAKAIHYEDRTKLVTKIQKNSEKN